MTPAASTPHARLAIIFVTVFVDLLGFGIVLPLLPYYAQEFHASGLAVGALIAVYSAMQFLCAPLWGRWSDRIGRRPVILISLAGSTLSYLLFALSRGFGLLFASRLLAGMAGANIPVAQAFIADSTGEEERARGMGLIGAAFGLGFVFGPAIGGVLARYGHQAPGFAATGICALNLLTAVWRLPESLPAERRRHGVPAARWAQLRAALGRPRLAVFIGLFAAVVFAFATLETTLSLLCAAEFGMSAAHIYWLFGYLGVLTAVTQGGLVGRLSRRFDEGRLALAGTLLLASGLGVLPFAPPALPLSLALAAIACGQGLASPVLSSLISKAGARSTQGEVLGVSQSVGSLARILGPLWGGGLLQLAGAVHTYVVTAALLLGVGYLGRSVAQPAMAVAAATRAGTALGEPPAR